MSCPNCGGLMQQLLRDERYVLHCSTCGGSFFEDNDINRITVETAQHLASDRSQLITPNTSVLKKCPKDGSVMKPVSNSEALPRSVTIFHCMECNGVFAGSNELLNFKKAQHIKLDYFKTWEIPLPKLKSVLIIFVFAVLSGSLYFSMKTISQRASYQSQASELIQKVNLYKSGRYILISFTTKTPFKSEILLHDTTTNEEIIKPIMSSLSTLHTATLSDIAEDHDYEYKIRLIDKNGIKVETMKKTLK